MTYTRNINKIPPEALNYEVLYYKWNSMRQRCINPNNPNYKHYGAKGIRVCEAWMNSFVLFYMDMNGGYEKGLTLDRINVYGNYEPSNCRWATRYVQDRNKTNSRLFDGKTLVELAIEHGFHPSTIRKRFYVKKWPIEMCLSVPVDKNFSRSRYAR